ncbi:MAG: hypothetical protein H6959_05920 [Chromatiaceae bacterium]|nr:TorF family putative porin [Gammaproteobacteria bacterium]MCP5300362.1 hypothetical protein [Chromatiaceae bacterium]MCP5422434.1 hypothetical protein [Chromatiaceae bacterium]
MKLNKLMIAMGVTTLLAGPAMAEISGNVALTSNYMFRGVSQNDNSWAIQGGLDYAHDSGFYIGLWGSNVDDSFYNGSSLELDTYAGWGGDVGPVSLDVGFLRYNYPDQTGGTSEVDTDEYHIGVSKDFGVASVGFTAYYSPDWFNLGDGQYYHLGVDVPVSSFTLSAAYGMTRIDENAAGVDDDYNDYSIGVSTEYMGLGFALTYVGVDGESSTGRICAPGVAVCNETVTFTVSKSL